MGLEFIDETQGSTMSPHFHISFVYKIYWCKFSLILSFLNVYDLSIIITSAYRQLSQKGLLYYRNLKTSEFKNRKGWHYFS